ncbi:MAG: hypothetical protein RL346_2188 [Verrucomicrobiota bacterium]|jgi:cation diffusion facilitator family transporter
MAGYAQQKRLMNLSLVAALLILIAKVIAAIVTGSSAIYSDAAESVVHIFVACFAAYALRLAHKPADDSHHFGHGKIAFISAGFEGVMISVAACLILYQAMSQFIHGVKIEHLGLGLAITAGAALINLALGCSLLSAGRRSHSPLLRANGEHVLTDVWTSAAVLAALALYQFTGWAWWDPVAATLAALNILRAGYRLFRESMSGLLDEVNPVMEAEIKQRLDLEVKQRGLSYHNFRYRYSGHTHWVEFHLVMDDDQTVKNAHHVATEIESNVAAMLHPDGRVISHLEPKSAEHSGEKWEDP